MDHASRISELFRDRDQLEKDLLQGSAKHGNEGSLSPHHRQQADEFRSRASAMRGKLGAASPSNWDAMKHEVEADWAALFNSFGRWVRHVGEEFERRNP
jgi:hypothetical protein